MMDFFKEHFSSEIPYAIPVNPKKDPEILYKFLWNPQIVKTFFNNLKISRESEESKNLANVPLIAIFLQTLVNGTKDAFKTGIKMWHKLRQTPKGLQGGVPCWGLRARAFP